MNEQTNLETIGIGTRENQKLTPTKVEIVKAYIEEVGEKKSQKIQCDVKHPQSQDIIRISSAKIEAKGKLSVGGLWFNQDEDGLIKKGSLLAQFLKFMGASNIKELEGKSCMTTEDDQGYLVFKAY